VDKYVSVLETVRNFSPLKGFQLITVHQYVYHLSLLLDILLRR